MEKGLASKASQAAFLAKVQEWVTGQKPWIRIVIVLAVKAVFIVADDKYADKLPEPLKETSRQFFDAILVDEDIDKAMMLGIELIPEVLELFKKKPDAITG
jgi:hypothetical protein